jgi:hypothetical protein
MTEFAINFRTWLAASLAEDIPKEVEAFAFNLFETANVQEKFGIEIIGSAEFDEEDSDWACEEIWSATPRSIHIPVHWSGAEWQQCLDKCCDLVKSACDEGEPAFTRLTNSKAVAVGFVDGDLVTVWKRQ